MSKKDVKNNPKKAGKIIGLGSKPQPEKKEIPIPETETPINEELFRKLTQLVAGGYELGFYNSISKLQKAVYHNVKDRNELVRIIGITNSGVKEKEYYTKLHIALDRVIRDLVTLPEEEKEEEVTPVENE